MRGPGYNEYRSVEHGDDDRVRKRVRFEQPCGNVPDVAYDATQSFGYRPIDFNSHNEGGASGANFYDEGGGNPPENYQNPVAFDTDIVYDKVAHDGSDYVDDSQASEYFDEVQPDAGEYQVQPDAGNEETMISGVDRPDIEEVEALNPDDDENEDPFVDLEEESKNQTVYKIIVNPSGECYTGTSDEAILLKWHYRLGHVNMRYLLRVAPGIPGMEELAKIKTSVKIPTCRGCALGKMKARALPKATFKRAVMPLDRLHLDMSGQIHCKSYGGHQYYLVVVDDATSYKWTYVLKNKTDYLACIDHLFVRLGEMPKILKGTPRALRTDNAGEMISAEARAYMQKHRIWHELCNPYEHFQNPRAESAIGGVGMRARTMLHSSGVPKRHWPQAVMYAAEIDNRTLPYKKGSSMTCYEAFHGVKPDNSKAMPFGCLAYLHRSKALRKEGKFDETALRCVFLGYAFHLGHKGYLLGSLTSRKFYVATNCNFAEGEFPYRPKSSEAAKEFWGEDVDGQGVKSVPFGPSIEAWDADGDDPQNVEIWLEEKDEASEAEAGDAPVRGETYAPVPAEEERRIKTRSMTRSNPLPENAVEVEGQSGTIVDGCEDMDLSEDPYLFPRSEPAQARSANRRKPCTKRRKPEMKWEELLLSMPLHLTPLDNRLEERVSLSWLETQCLRTSISPTSVLEREKLKR